MYIARITDTYTNEPVYIAIMKDIGMMMSCIETDHKKYKTAC